MKYLRPVFAGLCLVLSACEGIVGDPNVAKPSGMGGAAGSPAGSGGSTPAPSNSGGATGQGGRVVVDPGEGSGGASGAGGRGGSSPDGGGAGGSGGSMGSDAGNVDSASPPD